MTIPELCAFLTDMDAAVVFDTVYEAPSYAGGGRWKAVSAPAREPRLTFSLGELLSRTAFRGRRSDGGGDTAHIALLPSLSIRAWGAADPQHGPSVVTRAARDFVEGARLRGGRSLAVRMHRALLAVEDESERAYLGQFVQEVAALLSDESVVGFRVYALRDSLSPARGRAMEPAALLPWYGVNTVGYPGTDIGDGSRHYIDMAFEKTGLPLNGDYTLTLTLRADGADHVHRRLETCLNDVVRLFAHASDTLVDLVHGDRIILMDLSTFLKALVVPRGSFLKEGRPRACCTVWRADSQADDPADLTALLGLTALLNLEVYVAGKRVLNPCVQATACQGLEGSGI
jgi:hypothetical protein